MSILDDTLACLKDSGEIAIFMREKVTDEASWGVLLGYNEDFLLLNLVDMNGKNDGVMIFDRHQVTRVRWQTSEISSVHKLMVKNKTRLCEPDVDLTDIRSILSTVYAQFGYVSFYIDYLDANALILGKIKKIDADYVVIDEFHNKEAKELSKVLCALSDITAIMVADSYCEDIKFLNENID